MIVNFNMKFYKYIILILTINFTFAIGLKALLVPQTAELISLSSAGIAGNVNIEINPAAIVNEKSFISFSNNEWLGGLKGNKISYCKSNNKFNHYFSFEFLGIDDIELRDEQPSDTPIGYVESNWIAFDYAGNIPTTYDIDMGYKIKLNYSKLYTDRYYGYSFDFGLKKSIHKYLDIGLSISDVGVEYKSNQSASIDYSIGIGFAYNYPVEKKYFKGINIFIDALAYENYELARLGMKINFPYVSLMAGTSYSDGYGDLAYGLSFNYDRFELIIGNLNHENPVLGSPVSLEFRYHIK